MLLLNATFSLNSTLDWEIYIFEIRTGSVLVYSRGILQRGNWRSNDSLQPWWKDLSFRPDKPQSRPVFKAIIALHCEGHKRSTFFTWPGESTEFPVETSTAAVDVKRQNEDSHQPLRTTLMSLIFVTLRHAPMAPETPLSAMPAAISHTAPWMKTLTIH